MSLASLLHNKMDTIVIKLAVGLGLQNYIGWFAPVFLGMVNVVPPLMALFFYTDKSQTYNEHVSHKEHSGSKLPDLKYDFIVVGGGSAGSVVANRLSKHFNVLLLERGGEPNPLTVVPGMESSMLGRPEVDYRYLTVPQNNSCLACNNRQSLWNSGFGLGGSSILNAMVYIRGHPFDYDLWSYFTNDERWKYKNLLPYFMRSEGYCDNCEHTTGVIPSANPKFHGLEGELPVRPPPISPMVPDFLEALEWASVSKGDVNAPYYKPIADVASYTQKLGRRVTSYNAFVDTILDKRTSLKVLKYSRVIRVIFEPGTNTAIGVKYERFGKIEVAKANKEVILSADAVYQFLKNGTGPFTLTFARAVTLWTSTRALGSGEGEWPDIQVGMSSNGISQNFDEVLSQLYNLRADVMKEFLDPVKGQDAFSFILDYSRPRSRGVLRLASANYIDEPLIDPRYYGDAEQEDIRVTVEAIQRALYIGENAPAYKRLGSRLSPVPFPPCKNILFRSTEYWECVARQYSLTLHHFCGTASMGPVDSPHAVVDSELRVIGTKRLRVIDASVMPFIVSVNTNAATLMIGERGSEFVIKSWFIEYLPENEPHKK
ncbi:Glucose dehydrogenase [FAD, quinone] [Orchesella cincta]|uniref:Glucose dehydrogenase [FAD, quinone] n=1 Tax=Orchesella cincta TaxID=48709 RepID=A0A1D2NGI4_ORCCI|nr:Glucose dehydrogenase [FAD, quinone] [Orchesella cincta]